MPIRNCHTDIVPLHLLDLFSLFCKTYANLQICIDIASLSLAYLFGYIPTTTGLLPAFTQHLPS